MKQNKANVANQKQLLLVDDDPNLILLVKDYLEFRGYEVLTAGNGHEAIEKLKEDKNIPNLIICDVMMPEMDGYTFVDTIRSDSKTNWIPVVFLSAKGQSKDRIKGLSIGADVYMVKPFEPEELVAQVEATLKSTSRKGKPTGVENAPQLPVRANVELTPTEQKVVNWVARGMANREIAQEMNVSQRTIESHVSNMLAKTGLHNRTELARWAIETNIA